MYKRQAVYQAQISGTKEYGGEYSSIAPLMPAGIRTSTPHLSWTDDVYKDGDTVILELSGNYRHYHCPLARTMILGNASQKVRDLGATVSEGLTAALEGIKPGMLCEDVERIWAKTIAKSGFVKDSRIGYSMGCLLYTSSNTPASLSKEKERSIVYASFSASSINRISPLFIIGIYSVPKKPSIVFRFPPINLP